MSRNEAKTRKDLIDPILTRAGWDVHNPDQVGLETPADEFDPQGRQALEARLRRLPESWPAYDAWFTAVGPTLPGPSMPRTIVRLRMRMTRQQFYASFQAIGNLAEAARSIRVTSEADKPSGFDPAWLRNAVLEPLDEAGVEVEE